MLFSPINQRPSPPQLKFSFYNGKQIDDPNFRELHIPGPIVQSRPYEGVRSNYNRDIRYIPELPHPDRTLLQPERSDLEYVVYSNAPSGSNPYTIPQFTGHHYYRRSGQAAFRESYYAQDNSLGDLNNYGWYYSPYYRFTQYIPSPPEYLIVDTTAINIGYTLRYGDITWTHLFHPNHIGKLLFRRFDGINYKEDSLPSNGGLSVDEESGIYQSAMPSSEFGYCVGYRPIYNITQREDISEDTDLGYQTRGMCYVRYSPAWTYNFHTAGGGPASLVIMDLSPPSWHIAMPSVGAVATQTVIWIESRPNPDGSPSGTFTITIDGQTSDPIPVSFGSSLVSNIAGAFGSTTLDLAYISFALVDEQPSYTIASITFSSASGSPYEEEVPVVTLDNAAISDSFLTPYYYNTLGQFEVFDILYFFPDDSYSFQEGATTEYRKWYPHKPAEQLGPLAISGGNQAYFGMETWGLATTFGTFSPYRETGFFPFSYSMLPTNFPNWIFPFSQTPSTVKNDTRKIKILPVHL